MTIPLRLQTVSILAVGLQTESSAWHKISDLILEFNSITHCYSFLGNQQNQIYIRSIFLLLKQ